MAPYVPTALRQLGAAARTLLVLTVVLGFAYPLSVMAVGQVAFGGNADGSLVHRDGALVGSDLIGQDFSSDPAYFQARPSAAGDGYDPLATSASNLGPESAMLLRQIEHRREQVAALDGTQPADVAPDALLASGSGLDPQISPEYADQQVARVAQERGVSEEQVRSLVDEHTQGRVLGFLGEARVNVLLLNLALDDLSGQS